MYRNRGLYSAWSGIKKRCRPILKAGILTLVGYVLVSPDPMVHELIAVLSNDLNSC